MAKGMDRLQGHCNPESYMGFLYPNLMQLRHIYTQLSNSNGLKFCSPLATAILSELNMRFASYFSFSEATHMAALASISHLAIIVSFD